MESNEILELFRQKSALLEGHFELASKKHSSNYLQCALILQHPDLTNRLCQYIAGRFRDIRIDVVAGPAIGGVILAYEIARILGVRSIYAERKEAVLELRRGFQINNGERVLLVEDVITTGGSVLELASLCEGVGGKVIAVASLVDRTGGKHNMPYPFEALVQIDLPAYEREQCPLCRENVPLVKPGSQKLAHR